MILEVVLDSTGVAPGDLEWLTGDIRGIWGSFRVLIQVPEGLQSVPGVLKWVPRLCQEDWMDWMNHNIFMTNSPCMVPGGSWGSWGMSWLLKGVPGVLQWLSRVLEMVPGDFEWVPGGLEGVPGVLQWVTDILQVFSRSHLVVFHQTEEQFNFPINCSTAGRDWIRSTVLSPHAV